RGMLDGLDAGLRPGADTASAAAGRLAGSMSDTATGASQVAYRSARRPLTAPWPLLPRDLTIHSCAPAVQSRSPLGTGLCFARRPWTLPTFNPADRAP